MEEDLNIYNDYYIKNALLRISRKQIEECEKENKVPSKEVLDTINTLTNFQNVFFNKS